MQHVQQRFLGIFKKNKGDIVKFVATFLLKVMNIIGK